MSLQDLAPANSQRALKTALNVFSHFLASEGVTMGFIASALLGDTDGSVLVKLLDRFAVHLAFIQGCGGAPLARNFVMSYYRHVKNWLLDNYPRNRDTVEKKLLKMVQTLERHCLKRQDGGMIKKAPACTKEDLCILMDGLYYDASSSKDYQVAALLALMWYALGRASDLGFVAKSNLSVSSDGVIFVRFVRVKTAEEQGISLFPDKDDFVTCPLHAIGMALVMQEFPTKKLLDRPTLFNNDPDLLESPADISLVDALESCTQADAPVQDGPAKARKPYDSLKIHAYVNRIIKVESEVQARAKPTANLTSHSFRRGGAQHANSDPQLSVQWIFDRGSWNMTATNKVFAYVFNTTNEDQKVSPVLSGWDVGERSIVPTLASFDSTTRRLALKLGDLLFKSSVSIQDPEKKLGNRVVEVLTATLLVHLPEVLERYPMCLYASRVRQCLHAQNINMSDVMGWSSESKISATKTSITSAKDKDTKFSREEKSINHQNCVIAELVAMNRDLVKRLSAREKCQEATTTNDTVAEGQDTPAAAADGISIVAPTPTIKSCGSKAFAKAPAPIWYEWYAKSLRLWDLCVNLQQKSMYKQIANYMKLFLPSGFQLDPTSPSYCDDVLQVGQTAEENLFKFFRLHGIKRRNGSSCLKELRKLQRDGRLNALIKSYWIRVSVGAVVDPALEHTLELFVCS